MTLLQNTLNSVITRLSEHEKNLPKANHVREKVYQSYLKKVISDLKMHNTDNIATLKKNIEQYLRHNWFFIRKNLLSYTALPRDVVTLSFCTLAESLSQHKNEHLQPGEVPVSALDLLMPELNWISAYEQDYPSYVVIHAPKVDMPEVAQKLTLEEQEKKTREARLKIFASPASPTETPPSNEDMARYLSIENQIQAKRFLAIENNPSFQENFKKYNDGCELDESIKSEMSEYLTLKKDPVISYWIARKNNPHFMQHLQAHNQSKILREQRTRREAAESRVKKGEYKELSNNYFVPTNIPRILETHITSTDGKSLIPVMVLADIDNNKRPYCHDFETLQPPSIEEELARLTSHSSFSLALVSAKERWAALSGEDSHLLGQLQLLCQHFKLNDAHGGRGTQTNAGNGAFPALVAFYDYYDALSAPIKQTIPHDIRNEIDLLLKLASTPPDNTYEEFSRCIGTRREVLEEQMRKHQNVLIHIPSAADRRGSIELAEIALEEAKEAFILEYKIAHPHRQSHQKVMSLTNDDNLSADGDRLPLTKGLFTTFNISIDTKTLAGLRMVMAWNAEDIRETFKVDALVKKDFLKTINTLAELQSLCLEFSTEKLSALFSLVQPELFTQYFFTEYPINSINSINDIVYLLFGLSPEKQAFILTELFNPLEKTIDEKASMLMLLIKKVPDFSQSIFMLISNLSKDMQDNFSNRFLTEEKMLLLQNPALLEISLKRLDDSVRFGAIVKKNNSGAEILINAIRYPKSLQVILESLSDNDQRLSAARAILLDSIPLNHSSIELFLKLFSEEKLVVILLTAFLKIERITLVEKKDMLTQLLKTYPERSPQVEVVMNSIQDKFDNLTFLGDRTVLLQTDILLERSLNRLNDNARFHEIMKKNNSGKTILDDAIPYPKSLQLILKSISNEEQRLQAALTVLDNKSPLTPLSPTLMETLLEVFSEENRVIFMTAFFNIKKIELTEKKDMLINLMLVKPGRSQLILMTIDRPS